MNTYYFLITEHLQGYIENRTVYQKIIYVTVDISPRKAKSWLNTTAGKEYKDSTVFVHLPKRYHTQYMVVNRNGEEMQEGSLTEQGCPYFVVGRQKTATEAQNGWIDTLLNSGKLQKIMSKKRTERPKW